MSRASTPRHRRIPGPGARLSPQSAALAARATLEAALERRETRGRHNRGDYPETDASLHLVWSPSTGVTREEIPPIPEEIAALMREVSAAGKLLE